MKKMKLGICCPLEDAADAKAAGFDYFEPMFRSFIDMTDDEFAAFKAKVEELDFYPLATNVMLPAHAKVTGEEARHGDIRPMLELAFARAEQVGMKSVVFGSSAARNLPDGFTDRGRGYDQITDYVIMAGGIAARHNCVIAVEPLSFREANIVNFVAEAAYIAQRANHPNVRALADYFHMTNNREPLSTLYAHGAFLQHCHVPPPGVRSYTTGIEEYDYKPFFDALKGVGYFENVSVEGRLRGTMAEEGKRVCEMLRTYAY